MDRKTHIFLVMIVGSLSLAAFVVLSNNPLGFQATGFYWAAGVGAAWALMPWAGGLLVTGLNAGFAIARRRHVQFTRDLIWSTGLMMIMVVVATVANI